VHQTDGSLVSKPTIVDAVASPLVSAADVAPIDRFAFDTNQIDINTESAIEPRSALLYCVPSRDSPSIDGPVDQSSGQQLWECAVDLVEYLAANASAVTNRRVLELGCGHGLPGIWCLTRANAAEVVFQDRSALVLRNITMRTLALNCRALDDRSAAGVVVQRAQFVSGDWRELALRDDVLEPPFDLVLAAECLYSHESTAAFVSALKRALASDGVALVATKTLYFGIGGGSLAFRRAIAAASDDEAAPSGRILHVEQVREYADGKSNVRELLKVTWKSRRTDTETENE
jgi:SAM-dependent methyltransferase